MTPSRLVHAVAALVTLVAFWAAKSRVPELWMGPVTRFATVGGFVTIYGVVFAVIETWRARSASEQAAKAAAEASRRLTNLHGVQGIAACQTCIHDALKDLEKEGWTSTSALSRIVELYTAEFHVAYEKPTSPERERILALQSHAATANGPLKGLASTRLKTTLLQMLADMTAAAGGKLSEKAP